MIFTKRFAFSSIADKILPFAVVGGGPAGLYCAKKLLKNVENIRIDVFEKMPIPFGLIRYGVAPDNQDLKKFQNELATIANDERFNFYGNIQIGKDITVQELSDHYSGIIFAYGASAEHNLNIEGESLKGNFSGRDIASWYNGSFDYEKFDIENFEDVKSVVIIGNGNVALDVARIFSKKAEDIKATDISQKAFDRIKNNNIENIFIVARRGILQSAFSLKEIRDFSKVENVEFFVINNEIQNIDDLHDNAVRAEKRKMDFIKNTFKVLESQEQMNELIRRSDKKKKIFFRYLLSPLRILGNKKVEKIEFQPNILQNHNSTPFATKDPSRPPELISAEMVIRSIGYKSVQIDSEIPFENKKCLIPNSAGSVLNAAGIVKGLYTAGWVKTGPKGLLANTISNCEETISSILRDIKGNELMPKEYSNEFIKEKNLKYYTFDDWKLIDEYEKTEGAKFEKLRQKVLSKAEFIQILQKLKSQEKKNI